MSVLYVSIFFFTSFMCLFISTFPVILLRTAMKKNVQTGWAVRWSMIAPLFFSTLPNLISCIKKATLKSNHQPCKNNNIKLSFEPDSNQWPMDFCVYITLQSTALPTELSKGANAHFMLMCYVNRSVAHCRGRWQFRGSGVCNQTLFNIASVYLPL